VLLRVAAGRDPEPSAAILDARTLQSTPESGSRAGYDGHKRKKGSKVHLAVDTLGHLLAVHVTPANEQERDQVAELAQAVQEVTGQSVEVVFVDQGSTGDHPATAAARHGIRLEVVKLPEAKRGFVLLPRRWVIDRDFAWTARFRRLARLRAAAHDPARLPFRRLRLPDAASGCSPAQGQFISGSSEDKATNSDAHGDLVAGSASLLATPLVRRERVAMPNRHCRRANLYAKLMVRQTPRIQRTCVTMSNALEANDLPARTMEGYSVR
jgi:transposase